MGRWQVPVTVTGDPSRGAAGRTLPSGPRARLGPCALPRSARFALHVVTLLLRVAWAVPRGHRCLHTRVPPGELSFFAGTAMLATSTATVTVGGEGWVLVLTQGRAVALWGTGGGHDCSVCGDPAEGRPPQEAPLLPARP